MAPFGTDSPSSAVGEIISDSLGNAFRAQGRSGQARESRICTSHLFFSIAIVASYCCVYLSPSLKMSVFLFIGGR